MTSLNQPHKDSSQGKPGAEKRGNAAVDQLLAAPAPCLLSSAIAHKHDIILLQFSHDGNAFATGSRDGTLKVILESRYLDQAPYFLSSLRMP